MDCYQIAFESVNVVNGYQIAFESVNVVDCYQITFESVALPEEEGKCNRLLSDCI